MWHGLSRVVEGEGLLVCIHPQKKFALRLKTVSHPIRLRFAIVSLHKALQKFVKIEIKISFYIKKLKYLHMKEL